MIQWIRIFPEISIDVIFENIVRTMQRDKQDVTYDCNILFTCRVKFFVSLPVKFFTYLSTQIRYIFKDQNIKVDIYFLCDYVCIYVMHKD